MSEEPRIAVGLVCTTHDIAFEIAAQWMEIFRTQPGLELLPVRSTYVLQGRNQLTYEYLNDSDCPNLLMFDVDQMPARYEPDGTTLAERLRSVADLDVVCGLYVMRTFPYPPLAFREKDPTPRYLAYEEVQPILKERGLLEVDAVGTGAMLIKREVLEAVCEKRGFPDNPVWLTPTRSTVDDLKKRVWVWGEDLTFCRDARELGYRVWLDSRWESGHYEERIVSSRDYQLAARATYAQAEMSRSTLLMQEAERRAAQGKKLWVPGMVKN